VAIGANGEYLINGRPMLALALWLPEEKDFPRLKELGFNTVAGFWWNKKETSPDVAAKGLLAYSAGARAAGLYFVPPYEPELLETNKVLARQDHVLAWTQDDEPELHGVSPEECLAKHAAIRKIDPMRPVVIGLTAKFMSTDKRLPDEEKKRLYTAYCQAGDVVGFDTYPIFGTAWPGKLLEVGQGVRELRALAGPSRGLLCAIETNKGSKWVTPAKQLDVQPEHTRFEVWMALIDGATGITYFTHAWVPTYTTFAPDAAMQRELQRLNAQLTRLAPALLAAPAKAKVTMTLGHGLGSRFKATEHDGALYLFAQNQDLGPNAAKLQQFEPISPRAARAVFTVAGLKAGTKIEVIDERRTLTAEEGKFTDDFGPLAEHAYRIHL
jgi:hypothetical protein